MYISFRAKNTNFFASDSLSSFSSIEHLNTWEVRYCLLSWLSLVVMIPFSLDTVLRPVQIQLFMETCSAFLGDTGPARTAATSVLSNFLTRSDTIGLFLGPFLYWAASIINQTSTEYTSWTIAGVFETLILIFKAGFPSELQEWTSMIFNAVNLCSYSTSFISKAKIDLQTQLALVHLPKRPLPWLYRRGKRKLFGNKQTPLLQSGKSGKYAAKAKSLSKKKIPIQLVSPELQGSTSKTNSISIGENPSPKKIVTEDPENDNENQTVDIFIDKIVDKLLDGLSSQDSIVRWASAKGLGELTSRLSREYALDIIHALFALVADIPLEQLNTIHWSKIPDPIYLQDIHPIESLPYTVWEGWCLAIAELGRRGCLFLHFLPWIIKLTSTVLFYESRRGSRSIGTNVRDAACYLTWSLARAFHPQDLLPFSFELASRLLVVTLLDSHTQCRRAGSASLQENIGRCKNFPHGIALLGITDYYSIGSLESAFTIAAVEICQKFPIYRPRIIDRLLTFSALHWDVKVANIAHKTCFILAQEDPFQFAPWFPLFVQNLADSSSPTSQSNTISTILAILSGNFETISQSLKAKPKPAQSGPILDSHFIPFDSLDPFCKKLVHLLIAIYPHYRIQKLFRGAPGLQLRFGICKIISSLSRIKQLHLISSLYNGDNTSPFQTCSKSELDMYPDLVLIHYRKHLEANLRHQSFDLHLEASNALSQLTQNLLDSEQTQSFDFNVIASGFMDISPPTTEITGPINDVIHSHYKNAGYILGIGDIFPFLLLVEPPKRILDIVKRLISLANWPRRHNTPYLVRKYAIITLGTIFPLFSNQLKQNNDSLYESLFYPILRSLFYACFDFEFTSLGDVGSFVRKASISALLDIYRNSSNIILSTDTNIHKLFNIHGHDSNDTISSTYTWNSLIRDIIYILSHSPSPKIANSVRSQVKILESLNNHPSVAAKAISFLMEISSNEFDETSIPRLLIDDPNFSDYLDVFCQIIKPSSSPITFTHPLFAIISHNGKYNRFPSPLVKWVNSCASSGVFSSILERKPNTTRGTLVTQKLGRLVTLIFARFASTSEKAPSKSLIASSLAASIFAEGLNQNLTNLSSQYMLTQLGSSFPTVRNHAATCFYLAMLSRSSENTFSTPEQYQKMLTLLLNTPWMAELSLLSDPIEQIASIIFG